MKKIIIFLALIIPLLIPNTINASDKLEFLIYDLKADQILKVKDTFKMNFQCKGCFDTNEVKLNINYDKNILSVKEVVFYEKIKGTSKVDNGNINITFNSTEKIIGEVYYTMFEIEFTVKKLPNNATGSTDLAIKNIEKEGTTGTELTSPIYGFTRIQPSVLLNVDVLNGILDKPFDSYENNYQIYVGTRLKNLELKLYPADKVDTEKETLFNIIKKDKIEVEAKSSEDEKRIYTFEIKRTGDYDNGLRKIILDNGYIDFDQSNQEFTVNVFNNINKINFKLTPNTTLADVELEGPNDLEIGLNEYKITVTSLKGEVKEYKVNIIVTENSELEKLSNNNYLKDLKVNNKNFKFNKETLVYEVEANEFDDLEITAEPEDSNALVSIQGNTSVKEKDEISIVVTAENGENREYILTVVEKISSNNNVLIISGFVILGIILVGALYIINKRRTNKNSINKKGR